MGKIVIVEDELFMREELVFILEREGYQLVAMEEEKSVSNNKG